MGTFLPLAAPTNDYLERLGRALGWRPVERVMYSETTGWPPRAPLVHFQDEPLCRTSTGLSDPPCGKLTGELAVLQ